MILDDIAACLAAEGIAPVVKGRLPATPDKLVVLTETAGLPPAYLHNRDGPAYETPRVQVLVRAPTYEEARELAAMAFSALSFVRNTLLGGKRYLAIQPLQSPFSLPRDDNDRAFIAFNVEVHKEV